MKFLSVSMVAFMLFMLPTQHAWAGGSWIEEAEKQTEKQNRGDPRCLISLIGPVPDQKGPDKKTDFFCTRQQIDFACEVMEATDLLQSELKQTACAMQRNDDIKQVAEKLISGELKIGKDDTCDEIIRSKNETYMVASEIQSLYRLYLIRPRPLDWMGKFLAKINAELSARGCNI